MNQFDVIVVGGGAIGMASAFRLAQTGRHVLLLEKGRLGGEASSAAAGMLGAQLEVSEPGPFYHLCLESRSLYERFVQELRDFTGIDAQWVHNGIYQLAFTEDEARALHQRMSWQMHGDARAEWVDGETVAKEEPTVATCLGALLLPDDGNVNAPLLMRALAAAAHRACRVEEGRQVVAIEPLASTGYAVRTTMETFTAHDVVVASGAWATAILPFLEASFPIHPVKGQMLSIRPRQGRSLRHTLFSNHAYLVPKKDGTVVVGATEEHDSGFNRDLTVDAISYLLSQVARIAPGLKDAEWQQTWMGIRPGSREGQPWIGEVADSPGLHVAIGHFRNGILLTPVTAQMVVKSVEGGPWPDGWAPFRQPQIVSR